MLTSPIEFAFASWRRGTRFGNDASRAGIHSSDKHSMTNDSRKIAHSSCRKAIDPYITPRPMSAMTMMCLRLMRSTKIPAKGPNKMAGSVRATITPPTARPAAFDELGERSATREVTATKPTQSPSDEIDIAASRRENAGSVRRSLRVADLVPRSAATSSANVDTGR